MYSVYKVTNNINGKIYIGVHKTDNPYDSYKGTGVLVLKAQAKYGIKNFSKEVLFIYDDENELLNEEMAFEKEAQLVTQEFVDRTDTYNIDLGGRGGRGRSADVRKRIGDASRGKPGKIPGAESREKMRQAKLGRKLSEEHKANIGRAGKGAVRPESANQAVRDKLKGIPRKEEHKENMRQGYLNTPNKVCPPGGLECKPAPFKRWHGDNCKMRKN